MFLWFQSSLPEKIRIALHFLRNLQLPGKVSDRWQQNCVRVFHNSERQRF